MSREQRQLAFDFHRGLPTVINPYGLESPAEFFAVSVEAFFERAPELKARHPELYGLLASYFKQDPAARAPECRVCGAA
jgi:Mlc titration factor MtfA (ptsG expression regulator)